MFEENREIVNSIKDLDESERELLYSAVNIHGHACGDTVAENYVQIENGRPVCSDCCSYTK